ncbi:hypothetical protein [Paenibacillus glycinis]|uniref:DUF4367 domain-containing protein n=1 Tax=Paenibacillus glycinis TaxID=2697035 RepID=A0ABW9XN70_9BACL|nr:hypothetical protein [Paenibacillus glycinis]NBD24077.1 hypothetical protein [Paenibacillus glycinis]
MKKMLIQILCLIGAVGIVSRMAVRWIEERWGYALLNESFLDWVEYVLTLDCILVGVLILHKYAAKGRYHAMLLAIGAAILIAEYQSPVFGAAMQSPGDRYYFSSPTHRYQLLLEQEEAEGSVVIRAYQVESRCFIRTADGAFAAFDAPGSPIKAADIQVEWVRENTAKVTVASGGQASSFQLAFDGEGLSQAVMDLFRGGAAPDADSDRTPA